MSDHPEMVEQIKNMFDEMRDAADKTASDDKESFTPLDQVDEFANKVIDVHDISVKRHKAVRAVGFLEGFGALLWTQVGPNLADEEVAEFEKRVADIATYIGLPSREVDAK